MIITCDACSRRYLINPESLGVEGRTVKCASCGFSWHQDPPEDMPKILSDFPEDQFRAEETKKLQALEESLDSFSPEGNICGDALDRPISHKKAVKLGPKKYKWFIFGFISIGIVGTLYFGRYQIVDRVPYAEKLYEMIEIETNPLAHNLELQDVSWTPGMDENHNPIFILKGSIKNKSEKVRMIPPLSIAFLAPSGTNNVCKSADCIIDRWIARTHDDRILPGETYPFQIILKKTIPMGAANIHVQFVRP